MHIAPKILAACLALSSTLLAQQVHVVSPVGDAVETLQSAISSAASGDILLVESGDYLSLFFGSNLVVQGKSLTIQGLGTTPPRIERMTVRDVPAGERVILRGLDLRSYGNFLPNPALTAEDNDGTLWIEDCSLLGAEGFAQSLTSQESRPAVLATDCEAVMIVDSIVDGGPGLDGSGVISIVFPGAGSPGVDLTDSRVAVWNSVIGGGQGGTAHDASHGLPAGAGIHARGASEVFVHGSHVEGGGSGDFCTQPAGDPCPGGDAFRFEDSAALFFGDSTPVGGAGGLLGPPRTGSAPDGREFHGDPGASSTDVGGTARTLTAQALTTGAATGSVEYVGLPGDTIGLFLSGTAGWTSQYGKAGLLALAPPLLGPVILGTAPDGTLSLSYTVPTLPVGVDGVTLLMQAYVQDGAGLIEMSTPTAAVLRE